jgi:hypothetical protein
MTGTAKKKAAKARPSEFNVPGPLAKTIAAIAAARCSLCGKFVGVDHSDYCGAGRGS